jgi:integrase
LREYEQLNDERKPLVLEQERLAAEAKKAEAAKSSAMTVRKFAPIYLALPEMKAKDSADRDKQLSDHIVRLMGDKFLAEISRQDLFDYIDKRRGETLFRCGEWTAIRVSDGTIKNELSCLRHMLNLARRYKDDMAKKNIRYDVAAVSFDVMPEPNHRQRVLKGSERQRLLKETPVWIRRLFIVALETCLSRGDLLRLRWEDIDEESGTIMPDGGRVKSEVEQATPLTNAVKKVLANIKRERQHANVHNLETAHLVFVREDGSAITGDMMNKAQLKAFDRADVKDFHFHDTRHTIKTSWARRGIPVEAAMLGAGQASDVGKAFHTAKVVSIERKKAKK